MAKKSFDDAFGDMLGTNASPVTTAQTGGAVITALPTEHVRLDPNQPRHIIPLDLREELLQGKKTVSDVMFTMWERCLDADLYDKVRALEMLPEDALAEQRGEERKVRDLSLQITLEGLTELALSIKRHGLRQPINVYQTPEGYRIAEGERRWLAHVLLNKMYLQVDRANIQGRVQSLPLQSMEVLARQVAENAQRKDLSAIARARAIRQVHDMVKSELENVEASGNKQTEGRPREVAAAPIDEIDALAGQRLKDLTGKGLSGRSVRRYLAMLTLPPEAQALAEAAALTERAVRPILSVTDGDSQNDLVRRLAAGTLTPGKVQAEVNRILGKAKAKKKDPLGDLRRSLRFASNKPPTAKRVVRRIMALPDQQRDLVVSQARSTIEYLQEIVSGVDVALAESEE